MSETSTPQPEQPRRVAIGIMTGTSIDGLDAATIETRGFGPALHVRLLEHRAQPLGELAAPLRKLADGAAMPASRIAQLAWDFGVLHAQVIRHMQQTPPVAMSLDLVAVHGQTVFHAPPRSWQLLNPTPISRVVDCPVVFDLRQRDLALGGQGAPITPLADWIMFRDPARTRLIVNLGGFVNATLLPAGGNPATVRGADVCVCNQLLDAIARQHLGIAFDEGGTHAAKGTVIDGSLAELTALLDTQFAGGRSLGEASAVLAWAANQTTNGADLAATAVRAIARQIARWAVGRRVHEILLAGGGAHNRALREAISEACQVPVQTTAGCGVPVAAREAMAMAVLGLLAMDGVAITLPQVTTRSTQDDSQPMLDGTWLLPGGFVRQQRPTDASAHRAPVRTTDVTISS